MAKPTLLSGWYVILCGVHLRGTFLTGHGTSYDKCVGNTEMRNSPCKYKLRLNYLFHFDGSKYLTAVEHVLCSLHLVHLRTNNFGDKPINVQCNISILSHGHSHPSPLLLRKNLFHTN